MEAAKNLNPGLGIYTIANFPISNDRKSFYILLYISRILEDVLILRDLIDPKLRREMKKNLHYSFLCAQHGRKKIEQYTFNKHLLCPCQIYCRSSRFGVSPFIKDCFFLFMCTNVFWSTTTFLYKHLMQLKYFNPKYWNSKLRSEKGP